MIEAVTGETLDSFLQERITGPLGMSRTTLQWLGVHQGTNVAHAHAISDDATPCEIAFPNFSDSTGHAAGAGAKSTIQDLVAMYQSLLRAFTAQKSTGRTFTPGNPFAQVETIFSPQIAVNSAAPVDVAAYCLGLYKTRTPGNLSVASMNTALLGGPQNVPRIGTTRPGVEIFHHTGTIPGFLASCFLLPATESAVVVLTNSLPLMDPTNFVGQAIVALLLDEAPPQNYPRLSRAAALSSVGAYATLQAALTKGKTSVHPTLPLAAYAGDYWNEADNYVLAITERGAGLHMVPQRATRTELDLEVYDGNTFYWPADRELELCGKGMWPFLSTGWHKITFRLSADGSEVETLTWHHDPLPKPEVFWRHRARSVL